MINVGGFKFKPIHNFIPQTVSPYFIASGDGKNNNAPFISFGKTGQTESDSGGYTYQVKTRKATVNTNDVEETGDTLRQQAASAAQRARTQSNS